MLTLSHLIIFEFYRTFSHLLYQNIHLQVFRICVIIKATIRKDVVALRIDHDYVRQLLFQIEEEADGDKLFWYTDRKLEPNEPPGIPNQEFDRYKYHIRYMIKAGLLDGDNSAYRDLTPTAQEYIDKIRDNIVWEKFLSAAGYLGSLTASQLLNKVIEVGLDKCLP